MEHTEVIFEEKNDKGLPGIRREGNIYFMTKVSIPQFADLEYAPFFESIKTFLYCNKEIIIDFRLGFFNTKSSQVLKKLFEMLTASSHKCKPFVNWHYFKGDPDMLEYGVMKQEDYPKIKFKFIEDND
jgi:hypothetical protein